MNTDSSYNSHSNNNFVDLNLIMHNKAIAYAAKQKNSKQAQDIFDKIIKEGLQPDVYSYTSLMQAFLANREFSKVQSTFDLMQTQYVKPTIFSYNILLQSLIDQEQLKKALAIWQQMQNNRMEPDDVTKTVLFKLNAKLKTSSLAASLFQELQKLNCFVNSTIHSCSGLILLDYNKKIAEAAKNHDAKEAKNIFDQIIQEKLQPDIYSYTSLMQAFLATKQFSKVKSTFDDMQAQGIEPNVVSYNILLHSLTNQNKMQAAKDLWQKMQTRGIKPDKVTNSILVKLSIQLDNPQKTHSNSSANSKRALSQDRFSFYDQRLTAAALEKNPEKVKRIYQNILSENLILNVYLYASLIQAFLNTDQEKEAQELFNEMKSKWIQPNYTIYSAWLYYFAKKSKSTEAASLIQEMETSNYYINFDRMPSQGIELNIEAYNLLLKTFLQQDKLQEALALWTEMQKKGVQSNRSSHQYLLDLYVKLEKFDEATSLLNKMEKEGYSSKYLSDLTLVPYNKAISYAAKKENLKKAENIFNQITAKGLKADVYSYTSLMQAYSLAQQFSKVKELFDQMLSQDIEPTVFSYNILAQSLVHQDNLQEALALLQEMRVQGIQPDEITRQVLASIYLKQKNLTAAEKVFEKEDYRLHVKIEDREIFDCHGLSQKSHDAISWARGCIMLSFYLKDKLKSQQTFAPFLLVTGIGCHSDHNKVFAMRTAVLDFMKEFYPQIDCQIDSTNVGALICKEREGLHATDAKAKVDLSDHYVSLMDHFVLANQWIKVKNTFNQMLAEGIQPSAKAHNILLKCFIIQDNFTEVLALYQQMQDKGMPLDKNNSKALSPFLAKSKALHQEMEQNTLLLKSLLLQEASQKALTLWQDMQAKGIQPNEETKKLLPDLYIQTNNLSAAKQLFSNYDYFSYLKTDNQQDLLNCQSLSYGAACVMIACYFKAKLINQTDRGPFTIVISADSQSYTYEQQQKRKLILAFMQTFYPTIRCQLDCDQTKIHCDLCDLEESEEDYN